MSETYTTIIPNVKDEEGDDVILKIVFKKNTNPIIVSAEAFDSKGRYFYAKRLARDFEYYVNKAEEWTLEVSYEIYNDCTTLEEPFTIIYLCSSLFNVDNGLNEDKDSPYHLQSINNKISEAEEKLKKLKKKKLQCEKFYGNLNLI